MFKNLLLIFLLANFFYFTKQQLLPNIWVSDEEIIELVNYFYSIDYNAARSNEVELNYQTHTTTRDNQGFAKYPLFTRVDPNILTKPTFKAFLQLMDNYNPEVGYEEKVTPTELYETDLFLDLITNTTIGKEFYMFLYQKQHPCAVDINNYIGCLKHLWFGRYSRARGVMDSSGFEHVFMGELKNGEVSGLHNWFRFAYLESTSNKNKFDYKGYLVKRFGLMASVKYTWLGYYKKAGSFFISTSPEFDFFTYTLCFLFRRGNSGCNVKINGCPASITAYELIQNNNIYIGSLFPNIKEMTEECKTYNSNF
ncbi:Poly(U)-specific endoribonuclease [Strongyloides ratti]|uniref:Endoribonuclease n=1 Tax=Strongyloides ratti TaxID=34506 RepID=A0A090LTY4_STRRB|nr:Poly(U)-specific endoribonuclease [Strongyloides ratti]CEF71104.1 Poly(U)-specific endoribonuclease [Strongyloides ratti]